MRELIIDGTRIADDEPCYVIAELGHNHGGSLDTAKEMIRMAAQCGVSAVKLQKRDNANLYTQKLLNEPYENENSFGKTYGEHRAALEFGREEYQACQSVAQARNVTLFSTAFDERSADFLLDLGVPALKIASGDLNNTPLLNHIASFGVPVVISTGGGTESDIDRAISAVTRWGAPVAVLHCTAAYPVRDFSELNLRCILTLRNRYPDLVIGWSGHDTGIAMALVAYKFGARLIEKHVTLNRTAKGTDHAFSLEPAGLRRLVRDLERARVAVGDGVKTRYLSEDGPLRKMAKSLVAARDLTAGTVLRDGDLVSKSPAGGLPPYLKDALIGFPLAKPMVPDEPITHAHIKGEVAS
jgi:sialic acid synthase